MQSSLSEEITPKMLQKQSQNDKTPWESSNQLHALCICSSKCSTFHAVYHRSSKELHTADIELRIFVNSNWTSCIPVDFKTYDTVQTWNTQINSFLCPLISMHSITYITQHTSSEASIYHFFCHTSLFLYFHRKIYKAINRNRQMYTQDS